MVGITAMGRSFFARGSAWALAVAFSSAVRMGVAAPVRTGTEPSPASQPARVEAVRVVQVPWQVLDLGFRVTPGQAWMTHRVLSPGDPVGWASSPSPTTLLTGGDVGLTESLTLRLYGAQEFISSRYASMMMGFQLHLSPPTSRVQASIFQGFTEGSSDGSRPGQSSLSQFALKMTWPKLQLGYTLRGNLPLTGPASSPSLESTAGVQYAAGPVRLSVEHVVQVGGAAKDARTQRHSVIGSATTVIPKSNVQIGIMSSHGLGATPSVPAKVGVSLGF